MLCSHSLNGGRKLNTGCVLSLSILDTCVMCACECSSNCGKTKFFTGQVSLRLTSGSPWTEYLLKLKGFNCDGATLTLTSIQS